MAKKYKLTGCARFFIFLLIVAPIVYFGVSYFKGENPIEPLKEQFENVKETVKNTSDKVKNSTKEETTTTNSSDIDEEAIYKGTIEAQKKRIAEQADQIEKLEDQVKDLTEKLRLEKKRDVPVSKNINN